MPEVAQAALTTQTMGSVREPLRQPESAAQLTVSEASEIRERKRLIEDATTRAVDAGKIVQLLRNEHMQYLQTLVKSKGLDLSDEFNIDSDAGVVWRTARAATPEAMAEPMGDTTEG